MYKKFEVRKDADGKLVSHPIGEKTPLELSLESAERMKKARDENRRGQELGRALKA